jgi:hypothetical protein
VSTPGLICGKLSFEGCSEIAIKWSKFLTIARV